MGSLTTHRRPRRRSHLHVQAKPIRGGPAPPDRVDLLILTVFGSFQMVAVVPELEALLEERPSPEIEAVLVAARQCVGRRLHLWFIGD